jgi:hypothetical protein
LESFDFRKAIEKYPALAIEMLQMQNRRIRALEKSITETGRSLFLRCAGCGKIRLENGQWVPLDTYISDQTESEAAQVFCTDCLE